MKQLIYLIYFITFSVFAQNNIEATFVEKSTVIADSIIGVDNFNTIFYTKNNALIKKTDDESISYSNIQLGNVTSANAFNPLKINLFYKTFNTVVILDNRLAEIFKIDFNTQKNYKNITHISTGSDNTIWVFNQDVQQLELYDYKLKTTRVKALPISGKVIDITSNYISCWLLTEDFIYEYNYTGSLLSKVKNTGFTSIEECNENLLLKKGNQLHYVPKTTKKPQLLNIPNLLISQFFVTNQIVYIYTDKVLYQYQLKQ